MAGIEAVVQIRSKRLIQSQKDISSGRYGTSSVRKEMTTTRKQMAPRGN